MIVAFSKGVGRLALLAVALSVITAITLLLFGSWLLSWPVLRLSPQNRKMRTMIDLAAAAFAAIAALKPDDEPDDETAEEWKYDPVSKSD